MVQQVMVLATQHDQLWPIPQAYGGRRRLAPQKLSSDARCYVCAYVQTHKAINTYF